MDEPTPKEIEDLARDIYLAKYAKRGGRWELVESKEVWRKIAIERFKAVREAQDQPAPSIEEHRRFYEDIAVPIRKGDGA